MLFRLSSWISCRTLWHVTIQGHEKRFVKRGFSREIFSFLLPRASSQRPRGFLNNTEQTYKRYIGGTKTLLGMVSLVYMQLGNFPAISLSKDIAESTEPERFLNSCRMNGAEVSEGHLKALHGVLKSILFQSEDRSRQASSLFMYSYQAAIH